MPTTTDCLIRNVLVRDLRQVMAIEEEAFEFPLSRREIVRGLRCRRGMGLVATDGLRVLGFALYELDGARIHVADLAVAAPFRRQGIGRELLGRLEAKLTAQKRCWLRAIVREGNLPGQQFFRACGFRAERILHRFYEETDEDAYVMAARPTGTEGERGSHAKARRR